MKKVLAFILSIILIVSCFSTFASAESVRPLKTKFYLHYKNTSASTKYDAIALASKSKLVAGEYIVSFHASNFSSYSAFFVSGMNSRNAIGSSYSSVHHSSNTGFFPSSTMLTNSATATGVRTYKFTLTEEQAAGADYTFYISDFTVYETADSYKNNLLYNDNYVNTVNNWIYTYGGFSGTTSTQSTNAKLSSVAYGTGDANCDGKLDICDLVKFDSEAGTNSAYMNPLSDMDDNCALDKKDFTRIRKRLLVIQ